MVKPKFINNPEATKYFLSVLKGNITQKQIVEDLGLKTVKRCYSKGTDKVEERLETKTNITEKMNTLISEKMLTKSGKNKGTKYDLDFEGIFYYIFNNYLTGIAYDMKELFFINDNIMNQFIEHLVSFTEEDIEKHNITIPNILKDFVLSTAITSLENEKETKSLKKDVDFLNFCFICECYLQTHVLYKPQVRD